MPATISTHPYKTHIVCPYSHPHSTPYSIPLLALFCWMLVERLVFLFRACGLGWKVEGFGFRVRLKVQGLRLEGLNQFTHTFQQRASKLKCLERDRTKAVPLLLTHSLSAWAYLTIKRPTTSGLFQPQSVCSARSWHYCQTQTVNQKAQLSLERVRPRNTHTTNPQKHVIFTFFKQCSTACPSGLVDPSSKYWYYREPSFLVPVTPEPQSRLKTKSKNTKTLKQYIK